MKRIHMERYDKKIFLKSRQKSAQGMAIHKDWDTKPVHKNRHAHTRRHTHTQ